MGRGWLRGSISGSRRCIRRPAVTNYAELMRTILAVLVILAAGCADEKSLAPKFSLADVAIVEDSIPMVFRLKFKNTGITPIELNGLGMRYDAEGMFYDDDVAGAIAEKKFNLILALLASEDGKKFRVMLEDEWTPVEPKETREIYGSLQWNAPADLTPTVLIIKCRLVLTNGGEDVAVSEPFVMAMERKLGALESIEPALFKTPDKIQGIIEKLKAIDGAPTPRFRRMVERMEAMLPLRPSA
jgi:hypothetical protein